jgi:hypothetical protein
LKNFRKFFWRAAILAALVWWQWELVAPIAIPFVVALPVLAATALVIWAGYKTAKETFFGVPPNQAAIVKRRWFAGGTPVRTGRIVTQKELLPALKMGAKLPWVDHVDFVELREKFCDFKAKVIAMDGMAIQICGTFGYVPDFRILDGGGVPIFGTTTEGDLAKKADALADNKLAAIAGSTESDDILANVASIDLMLKGVLQTPKLPHLYLESGAGVNAKDLILFYGEHWREIDAAMKEHEAADGEHSDLELTNGIDVRWVKIKSPVLSAESQKAKDEKARVSAIAAANDRATEMVKKFMDMVPGASPQAAINFVAQELYGGTTTRAITSVEIPEGKDDILSVLAMGAANLRNAGKDKGK